MTDNPSTEINPIEGDGFPADAVRGGDRQLAITTSFLLAGTALWYLIYRQLPLAELWLWLSA